MPDLSPRSDLSALVRDSNRYQILGEHGRGGLGRVSRAHDRDLGRDVAIKELISRGHVSEVRFLREALITARLEHPGIVPIHEAGRWPDGTPFYAMKLVAGRPLRALIAERNTVDARIGLLHHVLAVADAIAYAHGRNIIHRDLKPANIIVGDFGETVVIDWGLAKDLTTVDPPTAGIYTSRTNSDDGLTSTGSVLGTPAYMAPEQERGERVDQRADVFAIGAMLWEICALQKVPPTESHLRHRVLRRAGIDKDLVTIIDKALDPNPDLRYPNAGALAADLKAFKSGVRIAARNYSLLAMLAHWTRRHRALACAASLATILAILGSAFYVQNISAEQHRTSAALAVATSAREAANKERDEAQLARATLLLDKDPTTAAQLLATLTTSTQRALLLNRAKQLSAANTIHLPGNIGELFVEPAGEAKVVTTDGVFASVDLDKGSFQTLARGLTGAIARDANGWAFAVRDAPGGDITVTRTSRQSHHINVRTLLADSRSRLLVANSNVYALDNQQLYLVDEEGPKLLAQQVRNIAGDAHHLMTCTTDNVLTVFQDGVETGRSVCAAVQNSHSLAVNGQAYTALMTSERLLVVRDKLALEIPVHITGEYSLSLSNTGLLALADENDKTWILRPQHQQLEIGPSHTSRPMSVVAVDSYAAWGYADGTVIAMDTRDGTQWTFKGHSRFATSLAIDTARLLLISTAGPEMRVWSLEKKSLRAVADVPATIFNIAMSPDRTRAVMDGSDGNARMWTIATNKIAIEHRHANIAFGVSWWHDLACSAGFDGKVLCTSPVGDTRELRGVGTPIRWLTTDRLRDRLVAATDDGDIVEFGNSQHILYKHSGRPYRLAFTEDRQFLASGAFNGSVMVFDTIAQRVVSQWQAHQGLVTAVIWQEHGLWTSGSDGNLKHWILKPGAPELAESFHENGSFRLLHMTPGGWVANVEEQVLAISQMGGLVSYRFNLGHPVQRIEISPDQRFIAAAVPGEVIVVDMSRLALSTISLSTSGIGFLGFVEPGKLTISTGTQLLYVSLNSLMFSPF